MKAIAVASLLLATPAFAAPIHQFSDLALAPSGDRTATVESDDPGNLSDEPHGAGDGARSGGKIVAHYDPCAQCRYCRSRSGRPRATRCCSLPPTRRPARPCFTAPQSGNAQPLTTIPGVANTARFSADGTRIALLVTLGAHKKTGATQAAAPLVGEIGENEDEQRIAVLPASGGELKPISPADTYVYEYSWTPDGKGFAATTAKGNGDNNWWIATLDYIDWQGRCA